MTNPKRNTRPPSSFQTVGPAELPPSMNIALDLVIVGVVLALVFTLFVS